MQRIENQKTQISIRELVNMGIGFEIPNYQRGYRWGKSEVVDLLNDIDSIPYISKNDENKIIDLQDYENKMYCLQPIVLDSREQNKEIVVDGQQRLTTIFLILKYINNIMHTFSEERLEEAKINDLSKYEKQLFISYEDKKRQKVFQEVIGDLDKINDKDIDAYYITNAYKYIVDWGKERLNSASSLNVFAEKIYDKTSVILYPLQPDIDGTPNEFFSKINTGRIPLTNSELIKANLMLKEFCIPNNNDYSRLVYISSESQIDKWKTTKEINEEKLENARIKISRQWDLVENSLRQDDFWYFLTEGSDKYDDTRIDFVFDIVAKQKYNDVQKYFDNNDSDLFFDMNRERASFMVIARYLEKIKNENEEKQQRSADDAYIMPAGLEVWKRVWQTYIRFQEWFNDFEWYHIIGFLIHSNSSYTSESLLKLFDNQMKYNNKTQIQDELLNEIKRIVGIQDEDKVKSKLEYKNYLEGLNYDNNYEQIKNILLWFNVVSAMSDYKKTSKDYGQRTRDTYFPFARYKLEEWNLEHIHSVKDEEFKEKPAKEYIKYIKKMNEQIDESAHKEEKEVLEKMTTEYESKYEELLNENKSSNQAIIESAKYISILWKDKYGGDLEDVMGIGNLTLLDETTNKSYQNAPFFMKRLVIKDIVNGKTNSTRFIPTCTRNVFDKTYTKIPHSMMHWSQNDAEDYLDEICDTIFDYLEGSEKNG